MISSNGHTTFTMSPTPPERLRNAGTQCLAVPEGGFDEGATLYTSCIRDSVSPVGNVRRIAATADGGVPSLGPVKQ
jgi:hypothetical protein